MEVRVTEAALASLGEYGYAASSEHLRSDGGDHFDLLAHAAAQALRTPFACICLPDLEQTGLFHCFGPGASDYAEFVAGLARESGQSIDSATPMKGRTNGTAAAIRRFVALPIGPEDDARGLICVFDDTVRAFGGADVMLLRRFAELATSELTQRRRLHHLHDELRVSREQAEEMSRLKSVFLTNISHETRTPLTTILGFAEILQEELGDPHREFVRLIQQGGKRLLNTLMSITDLARLESSSFQCEPQSFDIRAVILEACLRLEPLAEEKGIGFDVHLPEEPTTVYLDASAVDRTVSNLVSNAIKFTEQGGVNVTVEADDGDVLIHVADTGTGISADYMPHLFDEFKQESEGLARAHEGSGLGLPITKRLVELMKGKIMADSEKGYGTVFTVALPRNGETKRSAAGGPSDGEQGRARVLVVEDNADTRTLVHHLLRKSYDVALAANGEEALERARETVFDVLLVDINLGKGKSGEDVLREVKGLRGYESTPVVAVTAYAMPGDKERFFAEGFDDYVSKPFSKQRLLEALESVLR